MLYKGTPPGRMQRFSLKMREGRIMTNKDETKKMNGLGNFINYLLLGLCILSIIALAGIIFDAMEVFWILLMLLIIFVILIIISFISG